MFEKARQALQSILTRFETCDIPEVIAYSTFSIPNIPSASWPLLNRILMVIAGTQNARGFRQWMELGRHVQKGSNAFTILAPRFVKKESENAEDEKRILTGLLAVSVLLTGSQQ